MSINRRLGVPMVTGDENDALTRFKRFVNWRPGVRKALKRAFNRRVRRAPTDDDVADEADEDGSA
jgi:hypothetical protein